LRSVIRAFTLSALLLALSSAPSWAASVFYIRGGGNGHGVGLSQYGAYGYALHGFGYQAILAHYYQGTTLGSVNPSRVVRVLLQTGAASFSGATKAGSKSLSAGTTYSVLALANGQLALHNRAGKRIGSFSAPLVVSGPGPLMVAGRGSYRGSLEFRPSGSGVETIDAVGLDDYVRGVVAAEMPASWAKQALDAQAVAARTYAITGDVGGSAYQLYSDTRSQQYGGVGAETPTSNAAVAATRGQIVTYKGAPAITYFFSSSGGYTEDVQNAFPGASPEPWLRGVPDPYDGAGGDPYHRWTYRMSVATAASKLGGLVAGSLVGILVTKHGASPRILTAAVVGTRGRRTTTGIALQQRFGLMSTLARFTTITTNGTTVTATLRRQAAGHSPDLTRITAETASDVSALVRRLFAARVLALTGSVFPAAKGASLQVQRLVGRHWRTVTTTALSTGGSYTVRVPGSGTYRVRFSGLAGPTVSVG
jgi:stage II sporulation protein D